MNSILTCVDAGGGGQCVWGGGLYETCRGSNESGREEVNELLFIIIIK